MHSTKQKSFPLFNEKWTSCWLSFFGLCHNQQVERCLLHQTCFPMHKNIFQSIFTGCLPACTLLYYVFFFVICWESKNIFFHVKIEMDWSEYLIMLQLRRRRLYFFLLPIWDMGRYRHSASVKVNFVTLITYKQTCVFFFVWEESDDKREIQIDYGESGGL